MKSPLENLAKITHEHAVNCLIGTKAGTGLDPEPELLTSFTVIKPNGHYDILGVPWKNSKEKRDMVLHVALHILAEGAVGYCFTSEVWFAQSKHEDDKAPPPLGKPPRERPDRKEAVICLLSDGQQRQLQTWIIERNLAGICTALKEQEGPQGFESWIADGLDRAISLAAQLEQHPQFKEAFKKRLREFLSEP